ncbi:DUF616 domain-containing protein [Escherichia coli]|nr:MULTISPECIES: glycosyltransferase domain-containing protein [Enterobacteriaceae]HBR1095345.1 DUF616 domain-containing protein [Klebsiella variicola]HBR1529095.1 DUF616 domain-containing protein [Klebsiella quasipneumoniae subsp. quasipneumoniae]EHH4403769.1 DUF616 domain-containing protein [Escherichia coli]EIX8562856.1 DUF616 domain-containing protein [Escherichia coli]EJE7704763.1 DUF616 domain-containing protein [Escherichia coli]
MNNKYVIYTGIFGGYDHLIEPQVELHENIHLVCFTNNPELTSKKWKVIMIGDDNISDHMLNRKVKVLPHLFLQDYEYSLYVDGNIFLKNNFLNFFERYCKGEFLMALPRHLDRYCIYEEAKICILQKKDNVSLINKQMDFYQSQGYPKNNGLYENNILLRKHNDDLIRKIMEDWWEQLNTWSKRDQLSLCYVFWNHKFTPQILIESSRISNKYFDIELHSNYKKMPFLKRMFVLIDMKKHKNFIFKASFYLISAIRKIRGWI